MKQGIKALAILVLLSRILSSCATYKSITKSEAITRDYLSKLETGRKYKFELKTGQSLVIYLEAVNAESLSGYMYQHANNKMTKISYLDTFQNIEKNVADISILKINPYLTAGVIAVPVALGVWLFSTFTLDGL